MKNPTYQITCHGLTAIVFNFDHALKLAKRWARHSGKTAKVRSLATNRTCEVIWTGDVWVQEEYCTCDFCAYCISAGGADYCPKHPRSWTELEWWCKV